MKKLILGLILGLMIFVGVNACGARPYNDEEIRTDLIALKDELAAQESLTKKQADVIKNLTDYIG